MMDYVIVILLIAIFIANIVVNIWCTKIQCKSSDVKSSVIYCLYKELERMNDRYKECEKNEHETSN